jgi:hypothetical protein
LLVDKPIDNLLQEVNIAFDYFFDKCVYYFKAIDNNEYLEKDRFDTNNTDIIEGNIVGDRIIIQTPSNQEASKRTTLVP